MLFCSIICRLSKRCTRETGNFSAIFDSHIFKIELATRNELWYTDFVKGISAIPDRFGKQDIRAAQGSAGLFFLTFYHSELLA